MAPTTKKESPKETSKDEHKLTKTKKLTKKTIFGNSINRLSSRSFEHPRTLEKQFKHKIASLTEVCADVLFERVASIMKIRGFKKIKQNHVLDAILGLIGIDGYNEFIEYSEHIQRTAEDFMVKEAKDHQERSIKTRESKEKKQKIEAEKKDINIKKELEQVKN